MKCALAGKLEEAPQKVKRISVRLHRTTPRIRRACVKAQNVDFISGGVCLATRQGWRKGGAASGGQLAAGSGQRAAAGALPHAEVECARLQRRRELGEEVVERVAEDVDLVAARERRAELVHDGAKVLGAELEDNLG